MKTHEKVKLLEDTIYNIELMIGEIQAKCEHLNHEKQYGSNTGNYDPTADSYWITYKCKDCAKRWTVYD